MIDLQNIDYMPSMEDIDEYIESPIFMQFYNYLIETFHPICKIEYSKDVWLKGWNIKLRKAGKGLCVIYPKKGYFTVLVVVGRKEKDIVESLLPEFSKKVQDIYSATQEGMGQRWLMIDLNIKDKAYKDVLKLISIRRTSK